VDLAKQQAVKNDANYKAQRTSETVYEVWWLLCEPRRASRPR